MTYFSVILYRGWQLSILFFIVLMLLPERSIVYFCPSTYINFFCQNMTHLSPLHSLESILIYLSEVANISYISLSKLVKLLFLEGVPNFFITTTRFHICPTYDTLNNLSLSNNSTFQRFLFSWLSPSSFSMIFHTKNKQDVETSNESTIVYLFVRS